MVENSNISTEFNSNMLRLISLNKFLDECVDYSRMCYFNGYSIEYMKLWKNTLMAVYREISPKMRVHERKKILSLFSRGDDIGSVYGEKKTPQGTKKMLLVSQFKKHHFLLSHIEDQLRILADSRGMLMTNKNTEMDDMGAM